MQLKQSEYRSNQINKSEWILSDKSEKLVDETIFYVFVNLRSIADLPEYYIVPSKIVSDYITSIHNSWLLELGKKGQLRNDSSMRKFRDLNKEYLNR